MNEYMPPKPTAPYLPCDVCGRTKPYDEKCESATCLRIADLKRENTAIRELMNLYNIGGWTHAIPVMERAQKAEQQLAEARQDLAIATKQRKDVERLCDKLSDEKKIVERKLAAAQVQLRTRRFV